jgi:hypothetical protein
MNRANVQVIEKGERAAGGHANPLAEGRRVLQRRSRQAPINVADAACRAGMLHAFRHWNTEVREDAKHGCNPLRHGLLGYPQHRGNVVLIEPVEEIPRAKLNLIVGQVGHECAEG